MAIVVSIKDTDFKKRIDDIVLYQLDGKFIARTIGNISKERLSKSPQYEAFRKNQREFSLSSQLASTLQQALKPYLHYWKLPYANSILTGAFRKIIQLGDGRPGERSFNTGFLPELAGKGLDPTKAAFCFGKSLKLNHDTEGAYLRIPYGKLRKLFGSNALPLKVVIGLVALSDVEYTKAGYKLLQPDWHGKVIYNSRKIIDYWPGKGELRLKANFDHKIPDGVGLIGVFGVIPF